MNPRLVLSVLTVSSVALLPAPYVLARGSGDDLRLLGRVPNGVYALSPPHLFAHDVGPLSLEITNIGRFGNERSDRLNAGWHGGDYLYESGLWIGAVGSDSDVHVTTASPGLELLPYVEPRWTVYESFEGTGGGDRTSPQGADLADDDGDGLIDEDFHNGLDDDGDGLVDEDFAAIGQQMFSTMYRDDTPETIALNPDHRPLNVLIKQRSFAWGSENLNEFVGVEFEIINDGEQRLRELYLGFYSDSDAGPRSNPVYFDDDLVGWAAIDTTAIDPTRTGPCSSIPLRIETAFMWDAPDNGTSIVGGDVPGVFGSLFLGHTTDDTGVRAPQRVGLHTVAWFSRSGQTSDPADDQERYQLMASGTKPAANARQPADYRYVITAGPFATLEPGESLVFQTAYVIGDGHDGFRRNAVTAQRVFNGIYADADRNPETGIDGRERCLRILEPGDVIRWDDPCDTLAISQTIKSPFCTWVDDDCDPCTGVDGNETLINWVGTVPPPAPELNTDPTLDPARNPDLRVYVPAAQDRHVVLQWDNTSELRPDPFTGQDLFEGYRVWRADNWERPEGSAGPAAHEWMKIAEFRFNPEEAQEQGSRHLREITMREVPSIGVTDTGREIFPIGRYRYEDRRGLINGRNYFYAVTAFGVQERVNPITGLTEEFELGGVPNALEAESVVPRWEASGNGCDQVGVVPNPYRGGADWDLRPADHDPTGTKIAFRNLPLERSTIRIYTLAGDLVQEGSHDGGSGDGTWFWNLITRNGQLVVSGIYLWTVSVDSGPEAGRICRGRLVIIR